MISATVSRTKQCTFAVLLPSKDHRGMPSPSGTGFFISEDGLFLTAAHVIAKEGEEEPRDDVGEAILEKEPESVLKPGAMCQNVQLDWFDSKLDVALLRVDFAKNSSKEWLKGRQSFPYVGISTRALDDGEDVYSFGYPLSTGRIVNSGPGIIVGNTQLSPRVTSAIVSSRMEHTKMLMTGKDTQIYVLDKALNYGNSGGPIVAVRSGLVHAYCSRFQPVFVPQSHLKDPTGKPLVIMTPSLYGVVTSIANEVLVSELKQRGVVSEES